MAGVVSSAPALAPKLDAEGEHRLADYSNKASLELEA